jgi:hypothetical protein
MLHLAAAVVVLNKQPDTTVQTVVQAGVQVMTGARHLMAVQHKFLKAIQVVEVKVLAVQVRSVAAVVVLGVQVAQAQRVHLRRAMVEMEQPIALQVQA